ncbi:MAG: carbohydrate kinase family protein [Candidatus Helarchaeota archaeon]
MNFDITAIGAALIDLVAVVERFPDIDDEVFVPKLEMKSGGSAANFAVACAKLGLNSCFIGKIGRDVFGQKLIQDFKDENVNIEGVVYSKDIGTGVCYAAISGADRKLYAFSGAANALSPIDIKDEIIKSSKIVHLASLKNIAPLIRAAEIAKDGPTKISLNPGALIADQGLRKIENLLSLTNIYISPQDELMKIMGNNSLDESLKDLFNLGPTIAGITLGSKGSLIVDKNNKIEVPPYNVKAIDTTGAGDAFSAGFITGLLEGRSLESCGKMGNATAALKIQHLGAREGLPSREMIKEFIQKPPLLL